MRRNQPEHAIRTACQIIQQREVIVVGSQAILGTYDESQLPAAATMSTEVDILPMAETNEETARLADLIEGVAGEFSTFEQLHGFSIDGVDLGTAVLPDGWRERLVKVQNANTAATCRRATLHGLVPRHGRPLCGEVDRLSREGSQLRGVAARRSLGRTRSPDPTPGNGGRDPQVGLQASSLLARLPRATLGAARRGVHTGCVPIGGRAGQRLPI